MQKDLLQDGKPGSSKGGKGGTKDGQKSKEAGGSKKRGAPESEGHADGGGEKRFVCLFKYVYLCVCLCM